MLQAQNFREVKLARAMVECLKRANGFSQLSMPECHTLQSKKAASRTPSIERFLSHCTLRAGQARCLFHENFMPHSVPKLHFQVYGLCTATEQRAELCATTANQSAGPGTLESSNTTRRPPEQNRCAHPKSEREEYQPDCTALLQEHRVRWAVLRSGTAARRSTKPGCGACFHFVHTEGLAGSLLCRFFFSNMHKLDRKRAQAFRRSEGAARQLSSSHPEGRKADGEGYSSSLWRAGGVFGMLTLKRTVCSNCWCDAVL